VPVVCNSDIADVYLEFYAADTAAMQTELLHLQSHFLPWACSVFTATVDTYVSCPSGMLS